MKDHLFFYTSAPSFWSSCQSISQNLRNAYHLIYPKARSIVLDVKLLRQPPSLARTAYLDRICSEFASIQPSRAYFVDWELTQLDLLLHLNTHRSTKDLATKYIMHAYSDPVIYPTRWLARGPHLVGKSLRLRLSSEKEAAVLKFFLRDPNSMQYSPFPIDTSFFHYDESLRREFRKKYGISEKDKLILYTGRISLQKNVHLLVKQFQLISQQCPSKVHFIIAGEYDDYGADVLGLPNILGWYAQKMRVALQNLEPDVRSRVQLVGFQDSEMMRGLLNAADLFWSLSLHHNEGFGMSVAEALACGLPCVISDWAGFSSFVRSEFECEAVRIKLGKPGFLIDTPSFIKLSLERLEHVHSPAHRLRKSRDFASEFSIQAISKLLRKQDQVDPPKFRGFKRNLETQHSKLYRDLPPEKGNFYEKVYAPYFWKTGAKK